MNKDKKRALIVDDAPQNLHMLTAMLKEEYAIIAALSGEKAIELANKHMPDIILLDALMPDMDGFETCKELKSHVKTSDIPIIFISSSESSEDIERAFRLGAFEYIKKPVKPEILKERMADCLAQK